MVANGDGKVKARLVAIWENIFATGYVVANQSPKAFILFFFIQVESNISKLFKWSFQVRNQNRDSLDFPANKGSKSYSSYIAQS